jgi:hypothetical protein
MKKITPQEWLSKWTSSVVEGPDDAIIVQEFLNNISELTQDPMQIINLVLHFQHNGHTIRIDNK